MADAACSLALAEEIIVQLRLPLRALFAGVSRPVSDFSILALAKC